MFLITLSLTEISAYMDKERERDIASVNIQSHFNEM